MALLILVLLILTLLAAAAIVLWPQPATTISVTLSDGVSVGDLLAINGALYVVEGKTKATLLVRGPGKA